MYMEALGISRDIGISGFPGGSSGKETDSNAGDPGSIPGSESFSAEGNGNLLHYSCLENSMQRSLVHGVAKNWT